ncbi:hypothetical protein PanWU01x14_266050 [Parasponia andersonii]|uniref:Uncharacterized protein n=1 Tax=Parasponia andersonii TaxID=3476 RepID=A0A2P5B6T6_PARAD|nr:hypothetical protein PanWU01x14_266050 [Parasponia andersonii]
MSLASLAKLWMQKTRPPKQRAICLLRLSATPQSREYILSMNSSKCRIRMSSASSSSPTKCQNAFSMLHDKFSTWKSFFNATWRVVAEEASSSRHLSDDPTLLRNSSIS